MRIYLNDGWCFAEKFEDSLKSSDYSGDAEKVRIPHTVKITPFNYFSDGIYQMISGYRREITVPESWAGKRIILTFEGVAHEATVYVNGNETIRHSCGYTAFSTEITEFVCPGEKLVIAVRVDSNESLNVPPFGHVIDYMTYGGIYRDVYIDVHEQTYIKDVFVRPDMNGHLSITAETDGNDADIKFVYSLKDHNGNEAGSLETENNEAVMDIASPELWSPDDPVLYTLEVSLYSDGICTDTKDIPFGFRTAEFRADGFYLNGIKTKLRGLNRHQSWPYAGYAMPESMQREDARILKEELGVNAVRTSHYPQSHYFIDMCDRLGIMVVTEIPGWQNIGDEAWQDQAVANTDEMVRQYRNHTSIIAWGVRINESVDNDALYRRTNETAHKADPTRQTTGVRYMKNSSLLEDVYAYNDFVHSGGNRGCEPRKKVTPDPNKGYFISEYNGHMFPTKSFDCEDHRLEHALRHANVIDSVCSHDDISGCFGWCMFDYNTHMHFGSGDRICYHGVLDMFRNPKMASYVYSSEGCEKPFIQVSSSMDIGEHPAGRREKIYIFTNCDSVKMYMNDIFIREYTHAGSEYRHLKNPPILIDDYIGDRMKEAEGFSDRQNRLVKDILNYSAVYGTDHMSAGIIAKVLEAMVRYRMKFTDAYRLFEKYVGNWGTEAISYRFEGFINGKKVAQSVRSPAEKLRIELVPSSSTLAEKHSYDVMAIRVRITDGNGNIVPFMNTVAEVSVDGPAELIGPAGCEIYGGMGGIYLKSKGEEGHVSVRIALPGRDISAEYCFDISVSSEDRMV